MATTTFEAMRHEAYRLLGDAQDVLRSDWHDNPSGEQVKALHQARKLIGEAKDALNDAARS